MIIGHGIDAIEIARIRKVIAQWGDRFLQRIFTEQELTYCRRKSSPEASLAARFAAKEAFAKAAGIGIGHKIGWRDIEVVVDKNGAPRLCLHRESAMAYGKYRIWLSLSHSQTMATASVILEG